MPCENGTYQSWEERDLGSLAKVGLCIVIKIDFVSLRAESH